LCGLARPMRARDGCRGAGSDARVQRRRALWLAVKHCVPKLIATVVALLLAVNALVFWLVGRAVRPFGEIVAALNRLQGGRFDAALPRLAGTEAAAIGAAFNRMVGELQGHIDTEIDLAGVAVPAEVALALYRAAQEGITNALRHGRARHLRLAVQADANGLRLWLQDDGRGLPPAGWQRPGHYGLRWLAERIDNLHGTLRTVASPAWKR